MSSPFGFFSVVCLFFLKQFWNVPKVPKISDLAEVMTQPYERNISISNTINFIFNKLYKNNLYIFII